MANRNLGRVTRFQVMAVLQTARARALGLAADEAKSWGLNRALFYAAAKVAWAKAKAEGLRRPAIDEYRSAKEHRDPTYVLGGEMAFRARESKAGLRFKFGDLPQHPEEFDRKIKARFVDWKSAWSEAVEIIKGSPRRDLESQSRFFDHVYKPNRDVLAARWSKQESANVEKKKAA